jgi:hypothetical protein
MKNSLRNEWRYVFPAWLGCIFLPLPAIAFWRSDVGRSYALILFSIGCASLVAYTFQRDIHRRTSDATEHPEQTWRNRMATAAVSLFSAGVIFSLLSLALNDSQDFVEVILAFLIPIPALCVAPFFMLITRKMVAAVVFTVFTVFGMKLLGCIVVVLVYGWHASSHDPPYTDMPWTHPNLLVWLFWLNTGVLSVWLYRLGKRRYMRNMTAPTMRSENKSDLAAIYEEAKILFLLGDYDRAFDRFSSIYKQDIFFRDVTEIVNDYYLESDGISKEECIAKYKTRFLPEPN